MNPLPPPPRSSQARSGILAIAESAPGTPDDKVLANADAAGVLLLTADKDFGELVYRRQMAHCGVMLLRQAGLSIRKPPHAGA